MNELQRFLNIVNKVNAGESVSNSDLRFFYEYAPDVDQKAIDKFLSTDEGKKLDSVTVNEGLRNAVLKMQSDPAYKEQIVDMAQKTEKGKFSEKLSQGLDLILAGTDIASSIKQISESKAALAKSKKPSRPAIPARDQYLQQALRGAQDVSQGVQTALAPVQAQIQDQYLADLAAAKTASTGQAGAYGSYAQLAANRRNRAAMDLAAVGDDIRARNQGRLDTLIGKQMDETQQMFQNQASLYPYDLQQYGLEQQAAGDLGATGRQNLRNSLYNMSAQLAPTVADFYTQRKYRDLKNTASQAMGDELTDKYVIPAQEMLDKEFIGNYRPQTNYYQLYRNPMIA